MEHYRINNYFVVVVVVDLFCQLKELRIKWDVLGVAEGIISINLIKMEKKKTLPTVGGTIP